MSLINGATIRSLREEKGWDQKKLAEMSGIDASVISRLERNMQPDAKVSVLVAIAAALDVSALKLLNLKTTGDQTESLDPDLSAALLRLARYQGHAQRQVAAIIQAYLSTYSEEG